MYSGSGLLKTGVLGSVCEVSSVCVSNADVNDLSEIAVCGSERLSRLPENSVRMFNPFGSKATSAVFCLAFCTRPSSVTGANGFKTSLATFIITSNLDASTLDGSR